MIFVFGSNRAGRHGKGAALTAAQLFGAHYGQGEGIQGNSYAIPTKGRDMRTLPLSEVHAGVRTFLDYARAHPDDIFMVTPIGTGLAGFKRSEIAPLFEDAPINCFFSDEYNQDWRYDR